MLWGRSGNRVRHISCLAVSLGAQCPVMGAGKLRACEGSWQGWYGCQAPEIWCPQDATLGWQKGWQAQLGW